MEDNKLEIVIFLFSFIAVVALGLVVYTFSGSAFEHVYASTTVREPEGHDRAALGRDVSEHGMTFRATAYCLKGLTKSGVPVNVGMVAADPDVLPLGSIIRLNAGDYSGIYAVLDTGKKIKGKRIDLYLPTYLEAMEFGHRKVRIEIIRFGWDPKQDTPHESANLMAP